MEHRYEHVLSLSDLSIISKIKTLSGIFKFGNNFYIFAS